MSKITYSRHEAFGINTHPTPPLKKSQELSPKPVRWMDNNTYIFICNHTRSSVYIDFSLLRKSSYISRGGRLCLHVVMCQIIIIQIYN